MADPFLTRRYDVLDALKLQERERSYDADGADGRMRMTALLRDHGLSLRSETAEERDADLRHHIELRMKLDRAADGLRRR